MATRTFSSLHRFFMGLRSGDWLGHSRILMCFFLSHSFVALAMCFGSLSCWNTHPRPIFNALALTVHGPVHRPFDAVQLSCPLSRKTPPNRDARYTGTGKIPVYILYFKRYDIIILLNSVFHTLLLRSAPVGGSASQMAAQPVNVTTEQHYPSNRCNSYQRTQN